MLFSSPSMLGMLHLLISADAAAIKSSAAEHLLFMHYFSGQLAILATRLWVCCSEHHFADTACAVLGSSGTPRF